MSSYATKSELKTATGVDTSKSVARADLSSLTTVNNIDTSGFV